MRRKSRKSESRGAASARLNSLSATAIALVVAAGLAAALPPPGLAQDNALPEGFETQPVLKTTVTRDNQPIVYPTGTPQITSVIGTIEPGGRTPLHQHPAPVYVYILEGEVELRSQGGEPHHYTTGEAYIEALGLNHQLFNVGDAPARVLVVFAGEEGSPTTVAEK